MLVSGAVPTRASLAARVGVAPSRVSQILHLLDLHPLILERLPTLPPGTPERFITERALRRVAALPSSAQLKAAAALFGLSTTAEPTATASRPGLACQERAVNPVPGHGPGRESKAASPSR